MTSRTDIDIVGHALAPLAGKLSHAFIYERALSTSIGQDDLEAKDLHLHQDLHLLLVLASGTDASLPAIQKLLIPAEEAMQRRILLTALLEEEGLQGPSRSPALQAHAAVRLVPVLQMVPAPQDEVHVALARVDALVPEFNMVDLQDEENRSLAVTRRTQGVDWTTLKVGQILRCRVMGRLAPRVLSAELVDPALYTAPDMT